MAPNRPERADRVKVECVYCKKVRNKDSMAAHIRSFHPGKPVAFKTVGEVDYSSIFSAKGTEPGAMPARGSNISVLTKPKPNDRTNVS